MSSFGSSLHIELQQRGVEFTQLFGKHATLRSALLERMPPMEVTRRPSDTVEPVGDVEEESSQPESPVQHPTSFSESVSVT